jgi:DnaJ-class molecular chaperone
MKCPECNGKGWKWDAHPNGGIRRVKDGCYECGHTGELEDEEN